MIGTQRSWRNDAMLRPVTGQRTTDSALLALSLHGRRSAIANAEPEDVHLTGMTRSLDRRLLALNLKPAASVHRTSQVQALKVA